MNEEGGLKSYSNWIEAQRDRITAWEAKDNHANAIVPITFYSNELFGELGEAANKIKKLEREALGVPGSRTTPRELMDELADGLICLRNLSIKMGFEEQLLHPNRSGGVYTVMSSVGSLIAYHTGIICGEVLSEPEERNDMLMIQHAKWLQVTLIKFAKFKFGCDLEVWAVAKWNETSVKNGFPHRLELPQ